jgi:pyruvate dehydrogenase (quinone)
MSQDVSDFVLDRLRQWGATQVFGYPGDGTKFSGDVGVCMATSGPGAMQEFIPTTGSS